jgi:Tol biopolymer transport system component
VTRSLQFAATIATVVITLAIPTLAHAREAIAFLLSMKPGLDIAVMDTSGGSQRMLTEREATYDTGPFWSLDGSKIGFTSVSSTDFFAADWDVFVMDPDGSNVRNLTRTPDMKETGHAWTPDGRNILITEFRVSKNPPPDNDEGMYILDIDTGAKTPVGDPKGRRPSLSTDGTKLVYRLGLGNQPWAGIYTYDLRTGERVRLTFDYTAPPYSPAWSPDGTQIAYVATRDGGNPEIYIMDADGSNRRRITRRVEWDLNPTWSPDGRSILFGSGPGDGGHWEIAGLYIVDLVTGRRPRRVMSELRLTVGGTAAELTADTAWWGPELRTLAVSSRRKRAATWAALKSR